MSDGTIKEPRAFWEVRQIPVTAQDTDPQTVVLDLQNFYNDGKYPIVIEKIVVAPIGYYFKRWGDPLGTYALAGYASGSLINLAGLVFSARRRVSFPAKSPILSSEMANIASNPRMPAVIPGNLAGAPSSWTGAIYKNFTFPLVLPRDSAFYLELTNYPGLPSIAPSPPKWALAFHERLPDDKALFPGHARLFGYAAQQSNADPLAGTLRCAQNPFSTQSPVPPISPGGAPQTQAPTTTMLYPPEQSVRSREFLGQNPRDEGACEFYGMSCLINQIDYDDAALAGVAGATPLATSMLALSVGCRAQVRTAGTQARWWRDGMPLALAFDSITPALVYKLDRPITMDPGDQWEVEVTVPGVTTGIVDGDPGVPLPATYSLGVSLNGYAVIAG